MNNASIHYKYNLIRKSWYIIAVFLLEGLRWLLKGIADEAIFGSIYQWIIKEGGPGESVLDFFQSNPWYLWLILPIGILGIFLWAYVDTRKSINIKNRWSCPNEENLLATLSQMHERMTELEKAKEKKKLNRRLFKDACPLFFDKLGIIKISEWDSYEKNMAKSLKRLVPKAPEKKGEMIWRYKVAGVAQEMVKELVESKEFKIDDLVQAGSCLDSLQIGLGELRDNDDQWQELFKRAKPYTSDSILRELIDSHVSHSYAFCSVLLMISYGNQSAKNKLDRMLCSVLTSSDISPAKIEIALGEITEKVKQRLSEIENNSSILAMPSFTMGQQNEP